MLLCCVVLCFISLCEFMLLSLPHTGFLTDYQRTVHYFSNFLPPFLFSVIAFAGDALICAFRNTSEGISESCFRALQCAHVLRQHKTAYLSTHIGVTCGEMQIALLGEILVSTMVVKSFA